MAVQKNKSTKARRGSRRSHDAISHVNFSADKTSGELHIRHHLSATGVYKGRQVIDVKEKSAKKAEENKE